VALSARARRACHKQALIPGRGQTGSSAALLFSSPSSFRCCRLLGARSHPTLDPTPSKPQTSPGRAAVRRIDHKRHALLAGHHIRQSRVVPVRPEDDRRQQQTNTIAVRRTSSGNSLSLSRALVGVGEVLMCKIKNQPAGVKGLRFRLGSRAEGKPVAVLPGWHNPARGCSERRAHPSHARSNMLIVFGWPRAVISAQA